MRYEPSMIPQFIERLEQATSEQEVQQACQEIKFAVVERYQNENTRRKPMSEIRKAVKEKFPATPTNYENPSFPYYFTNSGKGRVNRWEHLAIKHLKEDWNPQKDWSDVENSENAEVASPTESQMVNTETELDILSQVGLNDEDLAVVRKAIGDADIKEWVKQAMLQRANAINTLHERLSEDLSAVSSEELMTDKKYRTNTNACRELTSRAVRAIKAFNAQSPEHRWCITNKLISELTGNTVKAIAKAVEGMDIESYNQSMDLQPIHNRLTKAAIGDIKEVVSIKDVLGFD